MNIEDVDNAIKTVQIGKIDEEKSTEEKKRICFKNYFHENGQTYFVVVEYYPNLIKNNMKKIRVFFDKSHVYS